MQQRHCVTSEDIVGAGGRWIPEADYAFIRARVPILSVDLICLSGERSPRIGLIRRETHNGQFGWCVVGGAVLRDEPLLNAVHRHLHATLGQTAHLDSTSLRFLGVAEYFTKPGMGEFYDQRKHSVAPTYFGRCSGEIQACGEALEFRSFQPQELNKIEFGFGQRALIARLLRHGDWQVC